MEQQQESSSGSGGNEAMHPWENNFLGEANKGTAVLSERMDKGFLSAKELGDWLASRAHAEQVYASELQRISKSFPFATEQGTLKSELVKLNAADESVAQSHFQYSRKLIEEMEKSVQSFLSQQRKLKQTHDVELDKCIKLIQKEMITVDRLKKEYIAKGTVMTQAVQQAAQGQTEKMTKKDYEKVMDKAIKAKKEADQAEGEYKAAISRVNAIQEQMEQRQTLMAKQYQQSEYERIEMMKSTLQRIADMQMASIVNATQNHYGKLRQYIDNIDAVSDLNEFCTINRTGNQFSPRLQFQPCYPGSPAGDRVASNLSRSNSIKPTNASSQISVSSDDMAKMPTIPRSATSNRVASPATPADLQSELTQKLNITSSQSASAITTPKIGTIRSMAAAAVAPPIVRSLSTLENGSSDALKPSSGHSSPVFLSREDVKATTVDQSDASGVLKVDTKAVTDAEAKPLDSGIVTSPESNNASVATPSTTTASTPSHGRVFSRKTVKMEGWIEMCDDSSAGQWIRNWCVLEGGFIWMFDDPAESSKPKGLNKPKGMLAVSKCSVTAGAITDGGWQAPQPDARGPHVFALTSGKRQLVFAAPSEEEMGIWMEELDTVGGGCNKR